MRWLPRAGAAAARSHCREEGRGRREEERPWGKILVARELTTRRNELGCEVELPREGEPAARRRVSREEEGCREEPCREEESLAARKESHGEEPCREEESLAVRKDSHGEEEPAGGRVTAGEGSCREGRLPRGGRVTAGEGAAARKLGGATGKLRREEDLVAREAAGKKLGRVGDACRAGELDVSKKRPTEIIHQKQKNSKEKKLPF